MSGIRYDSRPYCPGDEDAINELYFRVTGRRRSRAQWAWQWQQAPAGPGDIWLIEAMHPDGRIELIGHHGIMPVRFTWGEKDLLFGKTENTMVLPEYRRKILYPRFERQFAEAYEPRYHALFSTMGPAEAIRQRKAMGYTAEHRWVRTENGHEPWGSLARLAAHPRFRAIRPLVSVCGRSNPRARLPKDVEVLSADEARKDLFLADYWARARRNWGVSPRRDAEDLSWRYWDNPYSSHYAVVVRRPGQGEAVVVVEHYAPGAASIEDFSVERPDAALVVDTLRVAMEAVRKRLGVSLVSCQFTNDAFDANVVSRICGIFQPTLLSRVHTAMRPLPDAFMPRKITANGASMGLCDAPWNVTLAVSEGRR